ncbi:MAG: TRC40/GET3/ArsA family transport-energizing ATPase [Candidatus Aenigmarchaeota archaeon]|nr:TRC40/GET3/ArsA family transport-energizing ATPase [Candidatus Aenigmarchaeota archaeon]NIP41045.1 TRC40/GET3/ArsA family transport-energizing ATPase [Candidatus Aenigmarchaeota archaeon]NIQ17447.1 TRC40/GET3/ArsA family transport-energizing ATPase [Candidatus Aenigmarchaeota archaeon]NIS73641.1 TRC40/GET3/ArsA family transport-energizing ATPase [Candidatus Aenigmarchaeota archaeon]
MLSLKKRKTEFFLFGGKGGVGKTSVAAATALHFAESGKKTLIISTDPAHSLSDSFETKIGGEIRKLRKNLFAVEIDPKKAMKEYKEKIAPQMEKMDFLKGLGLEDTFDFAGNTPGIDELAAFDKFLQYMQSKDYDIIVFDTAPTGHTLRFLSLPDVLDSWVGKMINLRMKFSGVINTFKKILPFGEPKEEEKKLGTEQLEAMKSRIEEAKGILSDKQRTHFNLVTIPEAMSIYESERSLSILREYSIPVENIIVNQLIPENRKCPFCTEKRRIQSERMEEIRKKFRGYNVQKIPLYKEEVKGFGMLEKVGKELQKK